MNRLDELLQNGRNARFSGRVDEAVIFYEEAYRLSKQLKIFSKVVEIGVHLVSNLSYLGNNLKALTVLLDIFQLDKGYFEKEYFIWLKCRYLSIQFSGNPDYEKLTNLLQEIERFSIENNNILISTVFQHYSLLFIRSGQYEKALFFIEKAWTFHSENEHEAAKYSICSDGCYVNLELGNLEASKRWLSLYQNINSDLYSQLVTELCDEIFVLLFTERTPEKATVASSRLRNAISGFSEYNELLIANELIIRVNLLRISLGDPYNHLHTSKIILLDKKLIESTRNSLFRKHQRNILLIDYRLACLRFILNIKPVDDKWYKFNQELSEDLNIFNLIEIKIRIKKMQAAIKYAKILAEDLDERLECNIYMEEIQKREERLKEILEKLSKI